MEEEQECGDEAQDGEEETRVDIHRKAPDKHRHQLEMEYLTSLIHEKEALYKSLHAPKADKGILSKTESSREELLSKLRSLKGKKEKRMNRKQIIDAELKGLSQQLQKKRETCTKLQANLRYKDEQRTNDAIKRLEKHLSTQQLKLSEEKKLVSEIDCLRRSKKTISGYLCAKQDMDQLRQNQSKLRDERDTLIRETHSIKAKENDLKRCLDDIKTESKEDDSEKEDQAHHQEALKKEIDSLYERRREINGAYKQEMMNYREEQKKIERNVTKIKAEEKRDEIRISKMSVDRRRPNTRQEVEPYKVEKKLCACLIKYLEPYKAQSLTGPDEDKPPVQGRHLEVPKSELSRAEESQDGSFVMKKDNENLDGMFAVSSRRMSRKGSRKGRKSKDSCQNMVLHPHVFEQFLKLNLAPPSTFADVSGILKQLKDKKEFYEKSGNTTDTTDQRSLSLGENPALGALNEESVGLIGDESEPDNDSGVGKDTCGTIRDKEEHDKDLSLNSVAQISEVFDETQGLESLDIGAESVESVVIDQTSGISRTNEDSSGDQGEQLGAEDREIGRSNEQITSSNEKPTIEEKEIVEENEKEKGKEKEKEVITEKKQLSAKEEEFARNQENTLEIMKESCVKHSTVITDTLEKGLDSIGMKESSKEIEVRVT